MDVTVNDHRAEARYEARLGTELAGIAAYLLDGSTIVFTHTEVEPDHQGEGVAQTLARFALDDARARGLAVVPRCPFIAGFIDQHPEYAGLVH